MRPASSGVTLIELLVSTALFVTVATTLSGLVTTTAHAYDAGSVLSSLDGEARRILDRIGAEVMQARLETMTPAPAAPFGSSFLNFRKIIGTAGRDSEVGPLMRFETLVESGEVEDGIDNDGDGLVDEQILLLVRDPGGPEEEIVEIARGIAHLMETESPDLADNNGNTLVDEPGLCFLLDGRVLKVFLTLERRTVRGQPARRTHETSFVIRN